MAILKFTKVDDFVVEFDVFAKGNALVLADDIAAAIEDNEGDVKVSEEFIGIAKKLEFALVDFDLACQKEAARIAWEDLKDS